MRKNERMCETKNAKGYSEIELFISGKGKKKSEIKIFQGGKAAIRPHGGCSPSATCANWSITES